METLPPPHPTISLTAPFYDQLAYTLTDLLPPPLDDTPEALRARNHAAIAKVAALLPVNANEVDLAAQCIVARAQAEDLLRQLRQNAGDIGLVMRLNALYGSTVRTSLAVHGHLMRAQAVRQKREAIDGAATRDAWTHHVVERSMLLVVDPTVGPPVATRPKATPVEPAAETPAPGIDPRIAENVSKNGTDSQYAAFETWMSAQPWTLGSSGSDESGLRQGVRAAIAEMLLPTPRLWGQELPPRRGASPGRAAHPGNIGDATAST